MPGVPGAAQRLTAIAALATMPLAGCGSSDTTVAKTPQNTDPVSAPSDTPEASEPPPASTTAATTSAAAPADPCAVNLTAPEIAHAVSELPRDPRSGQPWSSEPVAGNYSPCADLSAVIVKANTNVAHPGTSAVLFHRGEFIAQSVADTYGFSGIDLAQCTPDTVALLNASGIPGLSGVVKFHWNGSGVEIIGSTAR